MNINKGTELLSPAGDMDSVYAAVSNGCNAIYLGGKDFSARDKAKNFTNEEINEIINYCHLRGVMVYIAINTLFKNDDLNKLFSFVADIFSYGADAFIVQDLGVAVKLLELFPKIQLHASTQMTAHNLEDVLFLQSIGFKRVVLARELSLTEIFFIKENCNIELEAFVHGALCVSYSGQCLMSSFIGQRSANKGKCAQPCRLNYDLFKGEEIIKSGCLLSPKDIMAIDIIDKIIEAGVFSLKIEGRMKSSEYVATVTKYYRKKIDELSNNINTVDIESNKKLISIFNRGGSSTGYYENYSSENMMSIQSPKHAGLYVGKVTDYNKSKSLCTIELAEPLKEGDGLEIWTRTKPHVGTGISKAQKAGDIVTLEIHGDISIGDKVHKSFDKALSNEARRIIDDRKINIQAFVKAELGNQIYLSLQYKDSKIEVNGEIVEKAKNQPMDKDKILSQLSKSGGTPFNLIFENYEIDDGIFVVLSSLNNLRRQALELLEDEILANQERRLVEVDVQTKRDNDFSTNKTLAVSVMNETQFETVVDSPYFVSRIYLEVNKKIVENIAYYVSECKEKEIELFIALPYINRYMDKNSYIYKFINILENSDISGYLIRSVGQLHMLDNSKKKKITDYTFNVANRLTYDFLADKANNVTLSSELNFEDFHRISGENSEIVVYGKPKLMTTAQCPIGLYYSNKKEDKFCKLKNKAPNFMYKDRTGAKLPIITDCDECTAFIYNDRPIFMFSKYNDIKEWPINSVRIAFTDESQEQVAEIVQIASETFRGTMWSVCEKIEAFMKVENSYTYGNFFKGSL